MIIVKSKMKSIPKSCDKCPYYTSEGKYYSKDNNKVCYAFGNGKLLNGKTRVTVERSSDCPLSEVI